MCHEIIFLYHFDGLKLCIRLYQLEKAKVGTHADVFLRFPSNRMFLAIFVLSPIYPHSLYLWITEPGPPEHALARKPIVVVVAIVVYRIWNKSVITKTLFQLFIRLDQWSVWLCSGCPWIFLSPNSCPVLSSIVVLVVVARKVSLEVFRRLFILTKEVQFQKLCRMVLRSSHSLNGLLKWLSPSLRSYVSLEVFRLE